MTITEIVRIVFILMVAFIIGAIPLIDWFTYAISGKELHKLASGNVSVLSAYRYGGKIVGFLVFLSEVGKGIAIMLLTRNFFPLGSTVEIIAIIALIIGNFSVNHHISSLSIGLAIFIHNPVASVLIALLGSINLTLWRHRQNGRIGFVVLMVVVLSAQRVSDIFYIFLTIVLGGVLIWIYHQEDNRLQNQEGFFREDNGILRLNEVLNPRQVGVKAGNLSQLHQWGYDIPLGWVVKAGDDILKLCQFLEPSMDSPFMVRTSILGEDFNHRRILPYFFDLYDRDSLQSAIIDCLSFDDDTISKGKKPPVAVIIQPQIASIYSGIVFSRDPVNQLDDTVCIEAVSGKFVYDIINGNITPQYYRVIFPGMTLQGEGEIPADILITVAKIAREIEHLSRDLPQEIEWCYDGDKIWLLQNRSITTLQPLWTRKIASHFFSGVICPLTWSINQSLIDDIYHNLFISCFSQKKTQFSFDTSHLLTLHYHRVYLNATFLGNVFLSLGLPSNTLQLLSHDNQFIFPSLQAILANFSGLWRLWQKELNLEDNFNYDLDRDFNPLLDELQEISPDYLTILELRQRITLIINSLKKANYYYTLANIGYHVWLNLLKVSPDNLDSTNLPEKSALKELKKIALEANKILPKEDLNSLDFDNYPAFFAYLNDLTEGHYILKRLQGWLNEYGYLSDVNYDVFIPRWAENSRQMKIMFSKYIGNNTMDSSIIKKVVKKDDNFKTNYLQNKLDLKANISKIYSQIFAYLRYNLIALEKQLLNNKMLDRKGDIFFLTLEEINNYIEEKKPNLEIINRIQQRQFQWQEDKKIRSIPHLIYGKTPEITLMTKYTPIFPNSCFRGIGISGGIVEGRIKILSSPTLDSDLDRDTIIVIPYLNQAYFSYFAQVGGVISEIGGKLSHGATIIRQNNIPAVSQITEASKILVDNQLVRLNGINGTIEIL